MPRCKKVKAEPIKEEDIQTAAPVEMRVNEENIENMEEVISVPKGATVVNGVEVASEKHAEDFPALEIPAEVLEARPTVEPVPAQDETPAQPVQEMTDEEEWQPFGLEKRRLYHEFNEEDRNVLNEKIADLAEKEIEMDEKVKSYQAILKGTVTEKKEALKLRNEGYEEREFDCPVLANYKTGRKIVKHPETGEILSSTFLTAAERQLPLFQNNADAQNAPETDDVPTEQVGSQEAPNSAEKAESGEAEGEFNLVQAEAQAQAAALEEAKDGEKSIGDEEHPGFDDPGEDRSVED